MSSELFTALEAVILNPEFDPYRPALVAERTDDGATFDCPNCGGRAKLSRHEKTLVRCDGQGCAPAAVVRQVAPDLADDYIRDREVSFLVDKKVRQIEADREARRVIAARDDEHLPSPEFATLAELATKEFAEGKFRVEGLMHEDGITLLTAQRKAGKTTMIVHLARCLLTGDKFLGAFEVKPLTGNVTILNYEVSERMISWWMADAGIPADRCAVVTLRGRRNPLTHEADRLWLAEELRSFSTELLIVDPFSNAFTGTDQNSIAEVKPFLNDLTEFAISEAGCREIVMTNHAGWDGTRTRGSSALEDWPDTLLLLEREKGGDTRFLSADGRDVSLPRGEVHMDPETRALTWWEEDPRSKATSQLEGLATAIASIAKSNPGIGSAGLTTELRRREVPHRKDNIQPARDLAAERGWIEVRRDGQKQACYPAGAPLITQPSPLPQPSPNLPRGTSSEPSPLPPTLREGEGGRELGRVQKLSNLPPTREGGEHPC